MMVAACFRGAGQVMHVVAEKLTDPTSALRSLGEGEMRLKSRDFH